MKRGLVVTWNDEAAAAGKALMEGLCASLRSGLLTRDGDGLLVVVDEDGRECGPSEVGEVRVVRADDDEEAGEVNDDNGTTAPPRSLRAAEVDLFRSAIDAGFRVRCEPWMLSR